MYIIDLLEKYKDKKIKIFVDMDGTIVDYEFGVPEDFHKKRPLVDSINKLREVNKFDNIELYIFSATRMSSGIIEKNIWLDEYASFFKKENRIILSREDNDFLASHILKANYIDNYNIDDYLLIVIDDDPRVLFEIDKLNKGVILLKDTVLVD